MQPTQLFLIVCSMLWCANTSAQEQSLESSKKVGFSLDKQLSTNEQSRTVDSENPIESFAIGTLKLAHFYNDTFIPERERLYENGHITKAKLKESYRTSIANLNALIINLKTFRESEDGALSPRLHMALEYASETVAAYEEKIKLLEFR